MTIEDEIQAQRFQRATGTVRRFEDIEGVGPGTARKLRGHRDIDTPGDVQDWSAEALAEEVGGVGEQKARRIIREAGGHPDIDDRGAPKTLEAGNIADAMDDTRRRSGDIVEERRDTFQQVVELGDEIGDRRERRRDLEAAVPFAGRDPDEVRELGRAADLFREATADPIDPTEEGREFGFNGETARERAARVNIAAMEVLEQEEGLGFDEARREVRARPSEPPRLDFIGDLGRGPGRSPDSPLFQFEPETRPTDIGRKRRTGRYARPYTDPRIDPDGVTRHRRTGQFRRDPFTPAPRTPRPETVTIEGRTRSVADTAVGWAQDAGVVEPGLRDQLQPNNGAELTLEEAADVDTALEGFAAHERDIADGGRATLFGDPDSHREWENWAEEARDDLQMQLR